MNTFTKKDIVDFVYEIDKKGGPDASEAAPLMRGLIYQPTSLPDPSLDPFSDGYVNAQLSLYREISGRDLNQAQHEMTQFDIDTHVKAQNPYASRDPSRFAVHFARLSALIIQANLPTSPKILDMGCGWGASSEFLATLGCDVVSVDINPLFVELIRKRALRHLLPVRSQQGEFDTFSSSEMFDAVVFYECLHHAVRPWTVIQRMANVIKSEGTILLAGEPINDYWVDWGLRLDPLSIYCIAKFGWFESGWSKSFIAKCFNMAGLTLDLKFIDQNSIGYIGIARKSTKEMHDTAPPAQFPEFVCGNLPTLKLRRMCQTRGWIDETNYLISTGRVRVGIPCLPGETQLILHISNYRGRPIWLQIKFGEKIVQGLTINPGDSNLVVPLEFQGGEVEFVSESWSPENELGNSDKRTLSFHLRGASYTNSSDKYVAIMDSSGVTQLA